MARPQKKGIDYFPHDSDMSSDTKIEMLELKFGIIGYAVYNKLLELSYKTGGGVNFSKEEILEFYSLKWKVENLKEVLDYMIKIKLFSDFKLNSPAINRRKEKIDTERNRKRGLYSKKKEFHPAETTEKLGETLPKTRNNSQTKLNKTKLNKTKEKESICIATIIPPTLEQVQERFKEKEYPPNEAEKFFNYYESNGWKVGKNKMVNWHSSASNWNKNIKNYNNGTTQKRGQSDQEITIANVV